MNSTLNNPDKASQVQKKSSVIDSFLKLVDNLNEKTGQGAAVLLVPVMVIVLYDVIARRVFSRPSAWAFDITYILWGLSFIFVLGWTMKEKGHVAIDIVSERLPQKVKSVFYAVVFPIFSFPFLYFMIVRGYNTAMISTRIGEASQSPFHAILYPLKWSIVAGGVLLLLQCIAHWIRLIRDVAADRKET